jgi:hypothetical protein
LTPGTTLDLGTIRLERTRRITVSYRVAPSPPFTQAPPERQILFGESYFKAGNEKQSASDLWFAQHDRKIYLGIEASCRLADLGRGKLDDFHRVDPTSVRFDAPGRAVPHQPGHVYLLEQGTLKHWVLFQVELDPEVPR